MDTVTIPHPDAVRRRIEDLRKEAAGLRRLLRISEQFHGVAAQPLPPSIRPTESEITTPAH
jgi:hypothetical protein